MDGVLGAEGAGEARGREEARGARGGQPEGRSPGGAESLGLGAPLPLGEGLRLERAGGKRILYGGNHAASSGKGRRLVRRDEPVPTFTAAQRLLILDTFLRSGLSPKDFAPLVGVKPSTLGRWKRAFECCGPEGLMDRPRGGPRGSRLNEVTKRTILMLKRQNPAYGCQRISDMLVRGPGLQASASAVSRVLKEAGYELEEVATVAHPDKPRRFERAAANQLWQSDLFTFTLKRQNRRVHLVVFMDDYSRFIVCWGLQGSASARFVIDVLESGIASYGTPAEVLTDSGPQYHAWRGESQFHKVTVRRGIKQLVSRPRHPQTLGKVERFWGTLWRDFLAHSVFLDLDDARARIGHFIDHYNFQRPHQGIEGLVPADRFFHAAPQVRRTLAERVDKNALRIARDGMPRVPFYMTGRVGGVPFSLHEEGGRMILQRDGELRREVDLEAFRQSEGIEIASQGARVARVPDPVCADPTAGKDFPLDPDEPELADGREEDTGIEGYGGEAAPGTSALDRLEGLDHG
jgi:transposase InsO family protein